MLLIHSACYACVPATAAERASGGEQCSCCVLVRRFTRFTRFTGISVGISRTLYRCIRRTWCGGEAAGSEQLLRLGVELQALGADRFRSTEG
jgi:hypothetical protein